MSTPDLVLYHFPGACSQVTVCALEQAGLPYRLALIDLAKNGQSAPDFLTISPLGKVPTLLINGAPLTENAAILTYIAALRPEAGLFPVDGPPLMLAEAVGGLSFCAGTLHPQVRGIVNPQRLTAGDGEPVRVKSRELATKSFGYAEQRLAARGWWLGVPSIIDVYLNWAFTVARNNGFDAAALPQLGALADRLTDRPAFVAMQQEEQQSRIALGVAA